nr:MAG TPA: LYSK, ENDOLYSIN, PEPTIDOGLYCAN, PROTEASE [Caudoviricetes sp.]
MAQFNLYIKIPTDSYDSFRSATLGNGYNVDGWYGNQCWDFISLLYWQYGRILQTKLGGGTAEECWTFSKNINGADPFEIINGKENIKRGDVVVWHSNSRNPYGHIALADEDYNGSNRIMCLGQNQRGNPYLPSTLDYIGLSSFAGIFRNKNWGNNPPIKKEEVVYNHNYKFYLYKKRKL